MLPISANEGRQERHSGFMSRFGKTMGGFLAGGIIIVMVALVVGVYQLSKFFITALQTDTSPEWLSTNNVPVWIVTVLIVLSSLGVLRVISTYITKSVTFIFKIAQSDIVTVILAIVVNLAWLVLNGWLTFQIIGWIQSSKVESFYSFDNFLSIAVMFIMLAGTFIWIPKLGIYGENKLGQFDDGR